MEKRVLSLNLFIFISVIFIFSVSMFAGGTLVSFMTQKKAVENNAQEKIAEALASQQRVATSTREVSNTIK